MKDLIGRVSADQNISVAEVRKVTLAVLTQLANNIDTDENFTSPFLRIKPKTIPQKNVIDKETGEVRTVPSRKVAIMSKAIGKTNADGNSHSFKQRVGGAE
jgi:hypothetical protein